MSRSKNNLRTNKKKVMTSISQENVTNPFLQRTTVRVIIKKTCPTVADPKSPSPNHPGGHRRTQNNIRRTLSVSVFTTQPQERNWAKTASMGEKTNTDHKKTKTKVHPHIFKSPSCSPRLWESFQGTN